jgi:MFS family permease
MDTLQKKDGKEYGKDVGNNNTLPQLTTSDSADDGIHQVDRMSSVGGQDASHIDAAKLQKKLVRKLDIRILPVIVLLYVLNYLDRNSISAARDNGLEADLKLDPTKSQYDTCLSILYVGYILLQVPSNLLLSYCGRPRIYIPICVAAWGIVSALSAVTHDFKSLLVVRFFLGVVEAAFFPGAMFILSKWYTRAELSSRIALLYAGSILSNAVSGLISAGILGNMEGKAGIRAWRWLFIIEGSITVFIAICAVFILPDFPHNSKMLTEEERKLAVQRMTDDSGGVSDVEGANGEKPIDGLKDALCDPIIWLFTLCLLACVIAMAFNQFFPTIVGTLGYDKITTLIITFGPWGWAFLAVLFNSLHANKTGERTFHLCIPLCIGVVGFIISSATENLGARFFALFLEAQSYAGYVIILAWMSNSIRGSYKRAAGLAFINCLSQLGNIAGSYVWPKKWSPSYWQSNVISIACIIVTIATAIVIRIILQRRNKELDRKYGSISKEGDLKKGEEEGNIIASGKQQKMGQKEKEELANVVAGDEDAQLRRNMEARATYRFLI